MARGRGRWKECTSSTSGWLNKTACPEQQQLMGETGPNERYEIILAVCPLSRFEISGFGSGSGSGSDSGTGCGPQSLCCLAACEACNECGRRGKGAAAGRKHTHSKGAVGRRVESNRVESRQVSGWQARSVFVCKAIGQLLDFD